MKRWEYQTVLLEGGTSRPVHFPPTLAPRDLDALNRAGSNGWEFVGWALEGSQHVAVVKREVQP